jgi:putative transposase
LPRTSPASAHIHTRRSKSLDTLIPIFYLKGVSTGDSAQAPAALLGKGVAGLWATTIARLKEVWIDDTNAEASDLSAKRPRIINP